MTTPDSLALIPDADLRPEDYNLKIGRYLAANVPKLPGEHRFITTTQTYGPAVIAEIRWCWDCGVSDHRAPERCTFDETVRDSWGEMAAANNRHHKTGTWTERAT